MDELLSLFDADEDSGGGSKNNNAPEHADGSTETITATHDVSSSKSFGDAFGGAPSLGSSKHQRTDNAVQTSKKPTDRISVANQLYKTRPASSVGLSSTSNTRNNNSKSTPCDPFTGLRIVDRRTSRADMIDAFSNLTYKSCSVLAASSKAQWATYMVDTASNGGGKTNLATCGILTSETSSKISAKTRRAFAIMSLGDLPSSMHSRGSTISGSSNSINASVSVFLFGDALSVLRNNKKYMSAGYAVAILGPNLMPPRSDDGKGAGGGGGTRVTLSVNDPRQILAIGRAMDCDRCKGTIRLRVPSEYGGVRWSDSRCSELIDMRVCGGYCQTHRRQGLSSSGSAAGGGGKSKSSNNAAGNMTFMQKQRTQSMPQKSTVMKGGVSYRQGTSQFGSGGGQASNLSEALSRSGLFEPAPASLLPESRQQLLKRAPLHMKKKPSSSVKNIGVGIATAKSASSAKNPYSKTSSSSTSAAKRKESEDILGAALERKRSRPGDMMSVAKKTSLLTPASNKRLLKVFNTGEGFNGAVPVPKPSKILFQRTAATTSVTPSPAARQLEQAQNALHKQRQLAGLLREKGTSIAALTASATKKRGITISKETLASSKQRILSKGGTKVIHAKSSSRSVQTSMTKNSGNDFASAFGGNDTFDREAIMNAKSCFSADIDAQEYARARAVVQQLEAKEVTKEGYNKKSSGKKDADGKKEKKAPSIVTSGWVCRTCKKKTPFKPLSCIRTKHDVRQQREIKAGAKSLGTRKERNDRHGRDAEEGGLTLGSGLEWSGWRGEL